MNFEILFKSSSSEAEHSSPKQISPQHLVALKALKNVLASSGIASNKPVHIKIEKGGKSVLKATQPTVIYVKFKKMGKIDEAQFFDPKEHL